MLNNLRAWLHGIADGFAQPIDLSTSRNVDHLDNGYGTAHEAQDRGINLGQLLRAGRRSQAAREGWLKVAPVLR